MGTGEAATLMLVLLVMGVVLVVVWVLLPFAIFGTKPRLDELIRRQSETNEHLRALRDAARKQSQ